MKHDDGGPLASSAETRNLPSASGLSLAAVPRSSEGPSPEGIVPAPASEPDRAYTEFAVFAHGQVREYIQLADQKAGFVFGAASAMLAFLHTQEGSTAWLAPVQHWGLEAALTFLGSLGLAGALGFTAAVVFPRTQADSRGLLSWVAIAARTSARLYAADVLASSTDTLRDSYLAHAYELARVCARKYRWLRWAFACAALGFGAAAAQMILLRGP